MASEENIEKQDHNSTFSRYCWQCNFVTGMRLSSCLICDAPLHDEPRSDVFENPELIEGIDLDPQPSSRPKINIKIITAAILSIASISVVIGLSFQSQQSTFGFQVSSPLKQIGAVNSSRTETVFLGDTFLGYSTLWSREFREKLIASNIIIEYSDEFNQFSRAQQLSRGDADFIVTTINQLFETPSTGKIVAMWDWTRGADRLVLNNKLLPQVQNVKDLNAEATKAARENELLSIILAGDTPSEYLSLLLADKSPDFSLEKFNIVRVEDSSIAWERFQNPYPGERFAAGIFWEPYITQATRQGYIASLSSANAQRSIVDVLVASPQVLKNNPKKVQTVVDSYYEHIGRRVVDKTALRLQFERLGDLSPSEALNFLKGVYFFEANCANYWMNGNSNLLQERLKYTARLLYRSAKIAKIPDDMKRYYDGRFVRKLADSDTSDSCPDLMSQLASNKQAVKSTFQPGLVVPSSEDLGTKSTLRLETAPLRTTVLEVAFDEETVKIDSLSKLALGQLLSSSSRGDVVKIEIMFSPTSSESSLSLMKNRVEVIEAFVDSQLPTVDIRKILRPEAKGHTRIDVSVGAQ